MVVIQQGNLLEANAEALVNSVNCVGVMGKGLALQFKMEYPANFKTYEKACREGLVVAGKMLVVATGQAINPKYIINFPTKRHWREESELAYIEMGLAALTEEIRRYNIRSIAVPPLGCGYGGLAWSQVRPMIEQAFIDLPDVKVLLYEPVGAPRPDEMPVTTSRPAMTRARAVFIKLMDLYRGLGYDLSLLEVQKLAYFLQKAGLDLGLTYHKQQFGPYAEKVNFVLQRMEGHYIRGYGDRSRRSEIAPLPGAIHAASDYLKEDPEAANLLGRVGQLIEGFETPYGLELLSTVHWVANEFPDAAVDVDRAIQEVQQWSVRKKERFNSDHIRIAWERLRDKNWLPVPGVR